MAKLYKDLLVVIVLMLTRFPASGWDQPCQIKNRSDKSQSNLSPPPLIHSIIPTLRYFFLVEYFFIRSSVHAILLHHALNNDRDGIYNSVHQYILYFWRRYFRGSKSFLEHDNPAKISVEMPQATRIFYNRLQLNYIRKPDLIEEWVLCGETSSNSHWGIRLSNDDSQLYNIVEVTLTIKDHRNV